MWSSPVVSLERLASMADEWHRHGAAIILVNGCFDLIHEGHVRLLQTARCLGDTLVVAINSDSSVQQLKGRGRPIIGQSQRAQVLAALRCVDAVTVFDDPAPDRIIDLLRPDAVVKGDDYRNKPIPEMPTITAGGAKIIYIPLIPGVSTSEIIRRIRALPFSELQGPSIRAD